MLVLLWLLLLLMVVLLLPLDANFFQLEARPQLRNYSVV